MVTSLGEKLLVQAVSKRDSIQTKSFISKLCWLINNILV